MQNVTAVVNNNGGAPASSSDSYRMPLVWIDLEMTGEFSSYHKLFYVINMREFLFYVAPSFTCC